MNEPVEALRWCCSVHYHRGARAGTHRDAVKSLQPSFWDRAMLSARNRAVTEPRFSISLERLVEAYLRTKFSKESFIEPQD